MFSDVTLGQYYPGNSFVHRLDARVKIILALFYLVGIFFIKSYAGYVLVLFFLLSAIGFSQVPLKSILRSIRGITAIIIITCILNLFFYKGERLLVDWWIFEIYLEGIITATQMVLRLLFLVVGSTLLTLTTTPVDLTHAIESLLKPLTLIKFPVHELALIMSLALSFIPSLIEETDRIIRAQKARGADFDTGNLFQRAKAFVPILIPLLVSSFRRADELAMAMNSRCYEGSTKRTKMHKMRVSWRDLVATLVIVAFFVGVFVLRAMIVGQLPKLPFEWLYI